MHTAYVINVGKEGLTYLGQQVAPTFLDSSISSIFTSSIVLRYTSCVRSGLTSGASPGPQAGPAPSSVLVAFPLFLLRPILHQLEDRIASMMVHKQ